MSRPRAGKTSRGHLPRAALMIAAALPGFTAPLSAQEKAGGQASLFLSYSCKPEERPAFRTYMEGAGLAQLEKWKKAGVFRDYLVLFTSYVNTATWDVIVRLDFDRFVDTQNWKGIERTMPGGLGPEGLAICSPAAAYLADLAWERAGASRDTSKAVYLAMPYEWEDKDRYKAYFDAKERVELDGSVNAGVVSWYGVYMNQNPSGKPWDLLFLLEYRDLAALGRREAVKQVVRKENQARNPGWSFAQGATAVREERQAVFADPVLPR